MPTDRGPTDYKTALQRAGAIVLKFKAFWDHEGTWWALVQFKGKVGWVRGTCGSCPQCDAFQAEFGNRATPSSVRKYKKSMREFGERYLHRLVSTQEAIDMAMLDNEWDMEAGEAVAWIKEHGQAAVR